MLLSKQQKLIVEILKQLKYLRVAQLHALIRAEFLAQGADITERHLDVMLRQLRAGTNYVRLSSDMVTYGARETDPRYLEAIDVMLELTEARPAFFTAAQLPAPLLIRFSGRDGAGAGLFSVAWLDALAQIPAVPRARGERIVWISSMTDPGTLDALPRHHFLALRQMDGSHRFYGSQEP